MNILAPYDNWQSATPVKGKNLTNSRRTINMKTTIKCDMEEV
jgi:hypothetical protein